MIIHKIYDGFGLTLRSIEVKNNMTIPAKSELIQYQPKVLNNGIAITSNQRTIYARPEDPLYRIKFYSRYGDEAISEKAYPLMEIEKGPYLNRTRPFSRWEIVPVLENYP